MILGAECEDHRDGLLAPMYMSNRPYEMATYMQVNWKSHLWAWGAGILSADICNTQWSTQRSMCKKNED